MDSSRDFLGEIKEKIRSLEVQLIYERKILDKTTDNLTEDKEKWKEEIKEAEAQLRKSQREIEEKATWLKHCQKELSALGKIIMKHEQENGEMDREIQKEKKSQLNTTQIKEQEVARLQENLEETQEQLKMATNRCEYIRRQQELEVNFLEDTGEKKMKEWFVELSNAFQEREKELEDQMRDLHSKLRFKRKTLWKMRDQLTAYQLERDDLIKKNEKLKQQVELLESP